MRCKNCHTVMMDTDTHCPSCHSSVERATAAAPGAIPNKPNGLLMALPVFGGALGGLAYAALTSGQTAASPAGYAPAGPSGGSGSGRKIAGIVLMAASGLLLMLASMQGFDAWDIARRVPKEVSATQLTQTD